MYQETQNGEKSLRTLRDQRHHIEKLELERAELLKVLSRLRKKAEKKAMTLKKEVEKLHEERESVKKLLDEK